MTPRPERAPPGDLGVRGGQLSDKALFISLSNVGDAIMTTPALELLHARYPEPSIDIVADRRSGEIFEHCPYRGEIFYKNKRAAWRGVPALLGQLRVSFYEVVVDLRSDGLAYLLRARHRYSKWGARGARGPHAVQRLMAIIEGLLGLAEIPPQRIWVNEAAQEFARRSLAGLPGRRWLVLGPGAKWPQKVWPAQRFIDMTKAVEDRFDSVIVLGGPDDVAPAAEVTAGLRLPVLNLAGQTSILEDCAVLAQAQVFVGNDSGLGHMASAVGIPTLTVFGPTTRHNTTPGASTRTGFASPKAGSRRCPQPRSRRSCVFTSNALGSATGEEAAPFRKPRAGPVRATPSPLVAKAGTRNHLRLP